MFRVVFLQVLTSPADHHFLMGLAGIVCGALLIYAILSNM